MNCLVSIVRDDFNGMEFAILRICSLFQSKSIRISLLSWVCLDIRIYVL